MSTFLPEDYESPKSSNRYMKIQKGDNKIRILTAPVLGWEDWIDNKPVRYRYTQQPPKLPHDPKKAIRHFWAVMVWNYAEEKIQILQITQATIRNNIEALYKDADWGEPYFYDLKIVREGEAQKTKYVVNPLPHKAINPDIIAAFNASPCYLEAIFENGDPFSPEWDQITPGMFEKQSSQVKVSPISELQAEELGEIFDGCEDGYFDKVMSQIKRSIPNVQTIYDIPSNLFDRIKNAAMKKSAETIPF